MNRKCDNCGKVYQPDSRNLKRGWGKCCNKSCAAKLRERTKPGYNPETVAQNNERRKNWHIKDSNMYGDYIGRHTSEGYRIYGNTAIDKYGEPVYTIDYSD